MVSFKSSEDLTALGLAVVWGPLFLILLVLLEEVELRFMREGGALTN